MKNEYDEEITGHIGDGDGYGDKVDSCGSCNKEIIVHYDWLHNVYEESIVFYQCKYCNFRDWYYN